MNRRELLVALLVLRERGPMNPTLGICEQVSEELHESLLTCFKDLDLPAIYPVPAPKGSEHDAEHWFQSSDGPTMWSPEHPYGAARLALLDRLIEHLEATK